MSTRFFLTNEAPQDRHKNHHGQGVATTSTTNINASPRFVKTPVLDSEVNSDVESISDYKKSPCSILSHDMSGEDDDFGVESFDQSMFTRVRDEVCLNSSGPQLIMPTVQLPSKRPFTQAGLNLGKLKLLICGKPGTGKTSLIQAITTTTLDIVHVDEASTADKGVWEISASTKPFPLFWLNDQVSPESAAASTSTFSNNRRPSLAHSSSSSDVSVLERNLCFVESVDCQEYLERQFRKTSGLVNGSSPQVLSLLTSTLSSEFSHVDACLYLVEGTLQEDDLVRMKEVNLYCPIVPLVAKSDLMDPGLVTNLKAEILSQMEGAGITPFSDDNETFPCGVSSIEDGTEMVASVLMSPDYAPELFPSELPVLCSFLFTEQGAAWLRYCTAKRFMDWSVSYHVRNTLSLVKLEPKRKQEYVVNLPSSFFTGGDKAQQETARWVMQLEQTSRLENALVKRHHHHKQHPTKRQGAMPRSIINLDPLNLTGLSQRALKYALRALSLILGVKIVAIIYSGEWSAQSQSQPQPSPPQALESRERNYARSLLATVQSLGWPFLSEF